MSKAITLTIPHDLGRAEARTRVDRGFADFAQRFGGFSGPISKTWEADRLRFSLETFGQAISGLIDVEDAAIRVEVLLPNVLALVADKLKGRLRSEGRLLLEKK
jgi:hypothetical protein